MENNAIRQMEKSMRTSNAQLKYSGNHLKDVCIKRGIFQGDSLSPLLFITPLIPLSVILREGNTGLQVPTENEG